jgi:predicted hotdog family 3-hydroxylacyl-ACP dehydratase
VSDILNLPLAADRLIPQQPPMRVIDRLTEYEGGEGVVESTIARDSLLVACDGLLEPVALVELIAQAFAAFKGYGDLKTGKPVSKGLLVEVKQFKVFAAAYGGEKLSIHIKRAGETAGFALAEGKVMRGIETIASGNIMVWIPGAES